MKNLYLIIIGLAASAATFAQSPVSVETGLVEQESIAATMSVSGVVISREDAAIASELEGRLTWIAEVGDRFSRGEAIATLDTQLIALEKRDRVAAHAAMRTHLKSVRATLLKDD